MMIYMGPKWFNIIQENDIEEKSHLIYWNN